MLQDQRLLPDNRLQRSDGLLPVDTLDQPDRLADLAGVLAVRHEVRADPLPQLVGFAHIEHVLVLIHEEIGTGATRDVPREPQFLHRAAQRGTDVGACLLEPGDPLLLQPGRQSHKDVAGGSRVGQRPVASGDRCAQGVCHRLQSVVGKARRQGPRQR